MSSASYECVSCCCGMPSLLMTGSVLERAKASSVPDARAPLALCCSLVRVDGTGLMGGVRSVGVSLL